MIPFLRRIFAFPLLAKDLVEIAARPRTYVLRLVFGCLFIGIFWLYYGERNRYDYGLDALLGTGAATFSIMAFILMGATVLLQPALMAGVLTHEKERETFPLLILADMSPWRLLIQKFLGGLLPMFTLLLFGLPLGAIAYAYGGVTPEKMLGTALALGGAWLQMGTLALLCSSWFRTTTSATIATYIAAAILIFGTDYVLWIAQDSQGKTNWRPRGAPDPKWEQTRLSPTVILTQVTAIADNRLSRTTHRFLVAVAPLYITAAAFLLLARMVLLHRAFAPPSHGGRRLFARLDALFERVNSKLGGAAYRQSRQHALPDVQPILWRETSRGILGRPQHLVRLGLGVLLVVCAVLTLLLLINPFSRFAGSLSFMGEALAVVGVLAVAACACDSLGRERTQQTLEVLLTTPIPPRDIIKEKLASAQRLSWIFIPNIALIAAVKFAILEISAAQTGGSDLTAFGSAYPWFLAACFLIGLPLMFGVIRWYAVWISIRIRNRSRALLVCLGVLALWVGTPIVLSIFAPANKQTQRWATAISPFGILAHADQGTFFKLSTYRPQDRSAQQTATIQRALIVFAIHGGMLLAFRTLSLRATRKYLRQ